MHPDQASIADQLDPEDAALLAELGELSLPEPHEELLPHLPLRSTAPQRWTITVAEAKFHWYDLIAGFPEAPDIRDPVGRQLRRLQFDLEAAMEKRLLYLVVSRPKVRFDPAGKVSWGFFSLKLTLPIILGADKRDTLAIELEVPFAATLKKPTVTVSERYVTLNWGGLVEALSIHDVLQNYPHQLQLPSTVHYVGQTRDPSGRLAKARLAAVQKIHQQVSDDNDTLLLIQRLNVEIECADGDPSAWPANQNAVAADALLRDRMEVAEAALIRYFEGPVPRGRLEKETTARRQRLRELQDMHQLQEVRIDLRAGDSSSPYHELQSAAAEPSRSHVLDCRLFNGEVLVTRVPIKPK
ncbi:hypothetical protein ACLB1G_22040 [Oxalobacteraceae bacterium A2-2]